MADYAVVTLKKELHEQQDRLRTLETQHPSKAVETDTKITMKRIEELQKGLKALQGQHC